MNKKALISIFLFLSLMTINCGFSEEIDENLEDEFEPMEKEMKVEY